jgi:multidrug resistance efflux pump
MSDTPTPPPLVPNQASSLKKGSEKRSQFRKGLKMCVAVSLLAAAAYAVIAGQGFVSSDNAVVSAYTTSIRAPIDGIVSELHVEVGQLVTAGRPIARLDDAYVDDRTLVDLRQDVIRNTAEQDSFLQEKTSLLSLQKTLLSRSSNYNQLFADYLDKETDEAAHDVSSMTAQRDIALKDAIRNQSLSTDGYVSTSDEDHFNSQVGVTEGELAAAVARFTYLKARADAARQGVSLDSGSNDVSYSEQRSDEVALRLSEVNQSILASSAAVQAAKARLAKEQNRIAISRSALVPAPANGMVWRVTTSNGEILARGAGLAQTVDCRRVFIIAAVPQSDFSYVAIGATAHIRLSGTTDELRGRVLSIVGSGSFLGETDLAAVPDFQHSVAAAAAIIELDASAASSAEGCLVGRTARVLLPVLPTGGLFNDIGRRIF